MKLPTEAAERQEAIISAIVEKWTALEDSGHAYPRRRYVEGQTEGDGETGYIAEFTIKNGDGENRVRYALINLIDLFSTMDAPGNARRVHYLYEIEINYQFEESRQDEGFGDNSTTGFNALLARAEDSFGSDLTLGFNEADASQIQTNGLETAERAQITYVDGTLCHSKTYNLEVTLVSC